MCVVRNPPTASPRIAWLLHNSPRVVPELCSARMINQRHGISGRAPSLAKAATQPAPAPEPNLTLTLTLNLTRNLSLSLSLSLTLSLSLSLTRAGGRRLRPHAWTCCAALSTRPAAGRARARPTARTASCSRSREDCWLPQWMYVDGDGRGGVSGARTACALRLQAGFTRVVRVN